MNQDLDNWLERMPVVAILRGVQPGEVVDIAGALLRAGVGIVEVPLNSPEPLESIRLLAEAIGDRCLCGAGTVVTEAQAEAVAGAGGQIAVSPNADPAVIRRSINSDMTPIPGWATPSEAYRAYQAGARHLKLFPAVTCGPGHIKAVRAAFPRDCKMLAVGGVGADVVSEWLQAGIDGFGIGTEIYTPGNSAEQVYDKAAKVVAVIEAALAEGIKGSRNENA